MESMYAVDPSHGIHDSQPAGDERDPGQPVAPHIIRRVKRPCSCLTRCFTFFCLKMAS
jgi:hypothetical protein